MNKASLLICLLLIGCVVEDTIETTSSGRDGVSLNFIPGIPPDKIWQGSGVQIALEVKNLGTSDIEEGLVTISGYDKNLIQNLESEDNSLKLYGKSDFVSEGELTIIEFKNTKEKIFFPENTETNFILAPFKAVACYKYKTKAVIPVCIDTRPINQRNNGICSVSDFRNKAGQGAPVAVVGVNQVIVNEGSDKFKAIYEIYFENVQRFAHTVWENVEIHKNTFFFVNVLTTVLF